MKNLFVSAALLIVMVLGVVETAQAGGGCSACVVDTTGCAGFFGDVCPDSIPAANIGVNYDENVTFLMPASIVIEEIALPQPITIPVVGITLDTIRFGSGFNIGVQSASLDSIAGLPNGISWTCNQSGSNCTYFPDTNNIMSQYGCVNLCGFPCADSGQYAGIFNFTYVLDLRNLDLSQADFPINLIPSGLLPDTVSIPSTQFLLMNVESGLAEVSIEKTPDIDYLCAGGAGSTVDLNVDGFNSYSWSTGSSADTTTITGPGTYYVTVTDGFGCSQQDSISFELLKADAGIDSVICSNQIVQLNGSGGSAFSWSPAANLSDDTVANPVLFELAVSTDFILTVDNGSCSDSDTLKVTIDNTDCGKICPGECTVDTTCGGLSPGICTASLPQLETGDDYSASFTFFFPDEVSSSELIANADIPDIEIPIIGINLQDLVNFIPPFPIPVSEIAIDVIGLPAGMEWECDQPGNDCHYYPSLYPAKTQRGCITLCGNDICDNAGDYEVTIVATIPFELPLNLPVPIPGIGNLFNAQINLTTILPLRSPNGSLDITTSTGSTTVGSNESVDLSVPTGFVSYDWSDGTSGATSITVIGPGTYSVSAEDDNGCVQTADITLELPSAIDDVQLIQSVKMYPNPTRGEVVIDYTLEAVREMQIEIITMQGSKVMETYEDAALGNNSVKLNLNELTNGIYLVRLKTEDSQVIKRLSILK